MLIGCFFFSFLTGNPYDLYPAQLLDRNYPVSVRMQRSAYAARLIIKLDVVVVVVMVAVVVES